MPPDAFRKWRRRCGRRAMPGQVPQSDSRLGAESTPPYPVDRAGDLVGVIRIRKGAGSVIDGFAGDRYGVGVHHAMDEPRRKPARNQVGLPRDDRIEERAIGPLREAASG